MTEKTYIDMLTTDNASIRKQQFTTVEGVDYSIGKPWSRGYSNSPIERLALENEVAEPYKTAILAVWGSATTVVDTAQ